MKIVQSFWSKPSYKKENINLSDRNKGGWIDKKYNYMSWALSCLQFRKFYDNVELVTDAFGYNLLVDKLELPYTNVKVCLDDINHYHSDLWALGKVYAYSIQDEPFIHADGDVFIYKKFSEEFENSNLVSQNIEKNYLLYQQVFSTIEDNFDYIPNVLFESKILNNQLIGTNAGILGGSDVSFFKDYTKESFHFVDKNLSKLSKINIGLFNIIFEQAMFYALSESKSAKVNYLLNNVNQAFDGLCDFITVETKTNYLHALGPFKQQKYIGDQLALRLLLDYPEYYYKIINLIKTNQL